MKIYSVSEMNRRIKNLLEEEFAEIWIQGEISNFKIAASGHLYFSLKDDQSQIRAVMFRGAAGMLRFRPENGLHVVVYGRVSVYEPRGEYQLIVEVLDPQGVGALQLAFEQLKRQLESEGLFDPLRKRALPFLPRRIGIVTSPTGAVIQDMIQILSRRHPNVQIVLYPVAVQGAGAARDIASAVEWMGGDWGLATGLEVLIVGRGGGSMEDLWAFNEEIVARAIAASRIPVVSAVGHETDFTIADFVADVRAPTPSAAAEMVMPVKEEILYLLQERRHHLYRIMSRRLENARLLLRQWNAYFRDPQRRLSEKMLQLDHLREKMTSTLSYGLQTQRERLQNFKERLKSLSPLSVLERGYAVVSRADDLRPLKNAETLCIDENLNIRLYKDSLDVRVRKITRH